MTRFQRLLYALGCARFKLYRRWIGGRWVERYVEPTLHSSEWPWRWQSDARASFLAGAHVRAIEQWPMKLPTATAKARRGS
jgi:hypothetical protein